MAIVPEVTVAQEVKLGSLASVKFSDVQLARPVAVVHKKSKALSPALENFLTTLYRGVGGRIARPRGASILLAGCYLVFFFRNFCRKQLFIRSIAARKMALTSIKQILAEADLATPVEFSDLTKEWRVALKTVPRSLLAFFFPGKGADGGRISPSVWPMRWICVLLT
ncbi:MAG: hypothetical protein Ct9H300mP32_1320 [Verrucomicrobiota bacterium]|nr:MAG: hypothetical protein Ct9H300mP32_1320 [Verrucomicrobiota bacterium]